MTLSRREFLTATAARAVTFGVAAIGAAETQDTASPVARTVAGAVAVQVRSLDALIAFNP